MKHIVNGVYVDLTDTEISQREATQQAWTDGANDRAAADDRVRRNQLLTESDWTQTLDSPLSDSVKAAWVTYRQALRDLPDHSNWPNLESGDWPTKP
tara:strand:- start:79 stop:369 length:291 start_codon:yes stop_codon:yes gene_type:complete